MKENLLTDLEKLKTTVLNISIEFQKNGNSVHEILEALQTIAPIETAIERSIRKIQTKGKTIPKKAALS